MIPCSLLQGESILTHRNTCRISTTKFGAQRRNRTERQLLEVPVELNTPEGAEDSPMPDLQVICRRYRVEILYAFGSRASEIKALAEGNGKESDSKHSDADIGVKLAPGATLSVMEKVRLALELEDLLGLSRIDLALLSEVDAFVAANIIRGERLYCDDGRRADEYDLYILRRAGDLAFLERERIKLIFQENE
jgi:predicted nucleotidyltransferase